MKSYVSAVKSVLTRDGYIWNDQLLLLSSIIKTCRWENDAQHNRFPIQRVLLSLILSQLEIKYAQQPYLESLYKTAYALAYYGLFRVGELTLTSGNHAVTSSDVHRSQNKLQYLFILRTSKTHWKCDRPQRIKIQHVPKEQNHCLKWFCPFRLTENYIQLQPTCLNCREQFLIHGDGSPLTAQNFCNTLKEIIVNLGLNGVNYGAHSFRSSRATGLLKDGYSVDFIKKIGRWHSNSVYKYLR